MIHLLPSGKYHIPNPSGKSYFITDNGVKISNDEFLHEETGFTSIYYESKQSNRLYPVFEAFPPITEMQRHILDRKNQKIELDGLKYDSSHRHATMFAEMGVKFHSENDIENAMLCKRHVINIWKFIVK